MTNDRSALVGNDTRMPHDSSLVTEAGGIARGSQHLTFGVIINLLEDPVGRSLPALALAAKPVICSTGAVGCSLCSRQLNGSVATTIEGRPGMCWYEPRWICAKNSCFR